MELLKDILRLMRWSNLLFLAALVWLMEKWVAVPLLDKAAFGEQMPWYVLLLLMAAIVLCISERTTSRSVTRSP